MARLLGSKSNVALVSSTLVLLSLATLVASVDTRPASVRARDWAVAHKSDLPTTLSEMTQYTAAYRLAAFREVSPKVRSSLIKEHIARFEATYHLTDEQREVLDEALPILTPEAYSQSGSASARARIAPLCRRIGQLFSKEEQAAFGTLGVTAPVDLGGRRVIASVKNILAPYFVQATDSTRAAQQCSCLSDTSCSGCSVGGGTCVPGGCSGGLFCGCFFLFSCDGTCQSI